MGKIIEPYTRDVFYYETDRMGIVHHSNYLRMMEESRIYYMQKLDMPYDKMEEDGIIIPVINAEVKYRVSLKYGDKLCVEMKLREANGVKFKCEYEIKNGEGKLCATGSTEHCFLNREMKLINFKRLFPEYYRKFMDALE